MLFAFYKLIPPASPINRTDTLFPTFIVTRMSHGIAGLLIAAILAAAMSNLSAALNSLSSTTIVDFYSRLRPQSSEAQRIRLSRVSTIFWALALFALAILSRNGGKVIENGLAIASIAYGGLLGVFLLGVLTRRASENGAILGFILGFAVNLYLRFGTPIAFTWYVAIGSIVTFITGYLASLIMPIKPIAVSTEVTQCNN
jgi:Na+/proline symporter